MVGKRAYTFAFRAKSKIFMKEAHIIRDESLLQDSFWSFRSVLMSCVTIHSPVKKLQKPMDAEVCAL